MNVVKCKNGHFFDGDTYSACPHCGAEVGSNKACETTSTKQKKGFSAFFDPDKRKNTKSSAPAAAVQEHTPFEAYSQPPAPEAKPEPVVYSIRQDNRTDSVFKAQSQKTVDLWQAYNAPAVQNDPVSVAAPGQMQRQEVRYPEPEAVAVQPPTQQIQYQAPPAPADSSLQDAVRKASATNEGKTMSYFSAMTASTGPQTAAPADPVVGWLVSIAGKHFGESFHICAGKNSIGRSENNRIVLNKDDSVSRERHALIVYEPKKRNFYLQPGDSSGLTYLNEEYITESKKLSARDMIEIGDSRFLFVPLCGDSFSWEDHISKG